MPRSRRRHGGTPSTPAENKGWHLGIDACVCVLFRIGKKGWVLANKSGGDDSLGRGIGGTSRNAGPPLPSPACSPGPDLLGLERAPVSPKLPNQLWSASSLSGGEATTGYA